MSGQDYYDWQHAYWAEHALEWEAWADTVAPQAEGLNRQLLEAAGIGPGARVLDLACGAGEPSLTAAELVGPDGHVTASDYSTEMLGVARRRAESNGRTNMTFEQADMQALPFADASFDHVISRFGFMYTEAPARAAAEILRVLRPGGRVALMVWGPMANNTVLSVALDAANARLEVLDEEARRHPEVYAADGSLNAIFSGAGFAEPQEIDLRFEPSIPAGVPFWQPVVGMNFGAAMRDLGPDEREALNRHLEAAHAPYIRDGKYRMMAHVRILKAVAPST